MHRYFPPHQETLKVSYDTITYCCSHVSIRCIDDTVCYNLGAMHKGFSSILAFNSIGSDDVDVYSEDSSADNFEDDDEEDENDDYDEEREQSSQIADGKTKSSQSKQASSGIQFMITNKMRSVLQGDLGYLKEEVDEMEPQIASVVIERRLVRPLKGMPVAWRRKNTDLIAESVSASGIRNGSSSAIVVKPIRSGQSMVIRLLKSPLLYLVAGTAVLWMHRGFILYPFRQTSSSTSNKNNVKTPASRPRVEKHSDTKSGGRVQASSRSTPSNSGAVGRPARDDYYDELDLLSFSKIQTLSLLDRLQMILSQIRSRY